MVENKYLEYEQPIADVVESILSQGPDIVRAEMVGWWCNYVVNKFIGVSNDDVFNSSGFELNVKRTLENRANVVCSVLSSRFKENRPDLLFSIAEDFKYIITSLAKGVLNRSTNYSFRCYLIQAIRYTCNVIQSRYGSSYRKTMMICGVLNDIVYEMQVN